VLRAPVIKYCFIVHR